MKLRTDGAFGVGIVFITLAGGGSAHAGLGSAFAEWGEKTIRKEVRKLADRVQEAAADGLTSVMERIEKFRKSLKKGTAEFQKLGDDLATAAWNVSAATISRAAVTFASQLRSDCAGKRGAPRVRIKMFALSVAECVVGAAIDAFVAASEVAIRNAVKALADLLPTAASDGVPLIRTRLTTIVNKIEVVGRVSTGAQTLAAELKAIVGSVTDAQIKAGAAAMAAKLKSDCATKVGAPTVLLNDYAVSVGECVVAAARAGFATAR